MTKTWSGLNWHKISRTRLIRNNGSFSRRETAEIRADDFDLLDDLFGSSATAIFAWESTQLKWDGIKWF